MKFSEKSTGRIPVSDGVVCMSPQEREEDIVRRFDRLIRYFASRFRVDREDLAQAGRIALLEAYRSWQTKPQQVEFWSYARKAVLGEMIDYQTREISRTAREELSGNIFSAQACPPDVALELKEHLASLPDREASVVTMHAAGFDVGEIGSRNDLRKTQVYDLIKGSEENIRKRA